MVSSDVYLGVKHLQAYFNCSDKTARKRYRNIRGLAGKDDSQQITMFDVSRIEKVPIAYVEIRIFGEGN